MEFASKNYAKKDKMDWIGCDGDCGKWFHYTCVGVVDAPKEDWFYHHCH